MSKIFEKNLILKTTSTYWRRFVAWVTNLHNRYWGDVFFQTEFNVIVLQIIFATVISVFVMISFNYLYKDILQTLLQGITENIKTKGTVDGIDIFNSIKIVKAQNFLSFFVVTVSVTLIFSYVIAKITLTPARNALRLQKRFISDIAHELRTPLSIIKANNEVALLDERRGDSRQILESNIEELDRASTIINNLLSFNNLIKPERIHFGPVDMGKVVDLAVKKLEELAKSKNVTLKVKKTEPSTVSGNTTALEQIAINLVKNAINYNKTGGQVILRVEPDYRGSIILSVEDNGIGISEKDLSHIFEPFYRAERSRSRKLGSSGLGLTIVSELVKLHKGKVIVKSRVNQGTTVTIAIPYSKMDYSLEKEEAVNVKQKFMDFKRKNDKENT